MFSEVSEDLADDRPAWKLFIRKYIKSCKPGK